MSEKLKHFITIVAATGESVVVDIELSEEEYELVNVISTLIAAEADSAAPIMVVSKAVPGAEHVSDGIIE